MNPQRNVAKSRPRSAPKTVDEYFDRLPERGRVALSTLRNLIRSVVPPETTEVISYNIPAFRSKEVLVWYAAFSNHVSLFPKAAIVERFKDDLKAYSTAKGTIQFPLDKPLPAALIKKIVKARVAEVERK
jgi:uncharacterized protein YdhG (YjbR/CyaY superfamily)